MEKKIDYLFEDPQISGQLYVCLSFLSPEGIKNCSMRGIKVRGVFSSEEQANKKAKELQEIDPDFNVFVGEVGKWLPWDPDPNSEYAGNPVYREEELNNLMKNYKENLEKAKQEEAKRKNEMVDSIRNSTKETKTRDRLKQKLEERKKELEKIKEEDKIKEETQIKEEELDIETKLKELTDIKTQINQTTQNTSAVDKKIEKIKKLYSDIKNTQ